jgi:GDPmannose 4,6-dehydratase
VPLGRLQHVRAGQDGQHAQRLVVLDEAHAAHVGGEHVDLARALGLGHRVLEQRQVGLDVLGTLVHLVPLVQRLDVDRPHRQSLRQQVADQMAADEATPARDKNVHSSLAQDLHTSSRRWPDRPEPTQIQHCETNDHGKRHDLRAWSKPGEMVTSGFPRVAAMQRALITGVAGQDGIYLARSLCAAGWRVTGTVRPGGAASARARVYLGGVELVEVDLSLDGRLAALVETVAPHEIYNLAAQSSVAESWRDPDTTMAVNLGTVEQLVRGALAVRSRAGQEVRLLQASSAEVQGTAANSPYAESKAAADAVVDEARRRDQLHVVSAFLHNHDSPLRDERFVTRKVTRSAAEIAVGRRETLTLGNLDVRRDWGFAGDYVRAMQLLLRHDEPVDLPIGTGRAHSLADLVALAFREAGLGDPSPFVVQDPALMRPADAALLVADPAAAGDVLGWRATTTFEELVAHMVQADLERLRSGVEEDVGYLFPAG